MSGDVVERSKAAQVDYEHAKALGVAVAPGRAYRLLEELVAEVERLRSQPGCCCGGCVL